VVCDSEQVLNDLYDRYQQAVDLVAENKSKGKSPEECALLLAKTSLANKSKVSP
jgi:hypothetical protein